MTTKKQTNKNPVPAEPVGDSEEITEKIEEDSDSESSVESEVDVLDPEFAVVELSSGTEVRVERLKMRQLMKLMKVLSNGALDLLLSQDFSDNPEELTNALVAAIVISIPESEEETITFLKSIVTPKHYIDNPISKQEKEANAEMLSKVQAEFNNPEIEDVILVMEKLFRREAPHIASLGKRIASLTQN